MKFKAIILLSVFFTLVGCSDDFLDTQPADTISSTQLASNPAALGAILNGVYANLRTFGIGGQTQHIDYGHRGVLAGLDMMGGDMSMSAFHWYAFWNNYDGREQTSTRTRIIWNTYYTQVAEVNSIINAISSDTDDASGKAFRGQALALRGFFTFNAARIYAHTYIGHEGDLCIPLPTGESFDGKPRSTVLDVYSQIVADLEEAVVLLEGYSRTTKQEVDLAVAQAFLASVYLEMGNWTAAASMANAARSTYGVMSADEYMSGFADINGSEVMWGADIDAESSTIFASFFSHFDNTNNGYAGALAVHKVIDASLYDQMSNTDVRKALFLDRFGTVNQMADPTGSIGELELTPYSNIKFRDATFFEGDYIYFRSAEVYLIEAEALARMGDANAAQVLFDLVGTRDTGYSLSTATGDALVEEIYLQRRVELWGEGRSWFDLKRLKKPLMRDYEGSNHASFGLFNFEPEANEFRFQIPEDEINANDAISADEQNPL